MPVGSALNLASVSVARQRSTRFSRPAIQADLIEVLSLLTGAAELDITIDRNADSDAQPSTQMPRRDVMPQP
jgi:hypothetical protein